MIQNDYYESDDQVAQYCEFHYGDIYFDVPNYPQSCIEFCMKRMEGRMKQRALDLGCAVGRSTFELARQFESVTGIDFSERFIQTSIEMQEKGCIHYVLSDEGELVSHHKRQLADFNLEDTRTRVAFHQGDAQNLKAHFTDYDLIFAGNLIDRLPDPIQFLTRIHERLNMGGVLVITSPYTWLTTFTPRDKWVGGFQKDGKPFTTQDGLKILLSTHFKLLDDTDQIPFVIRETKRKFQHTIADVTAWERTK